MDALLEGATKQVEDPTNLALHNKLAMLDNKENVQGKGTELFGLETNQELHEDELRSLEEQIRNQEISWILQERELQSELQRKQELQRELETELQRV